MRTGLAKTVALVGMMGAGKTAVGTAMARMLDVPFLDSDAEIVAASNLSIAEIFEREGEAYFRDKESQVLARLLSGRPCILSTGGGAFLSERNRAEIAARGVAVWLKADLDLLWSRVRHKNTRPLLRTENPKRTLAALCDAREPLYAKAGIWVEADRRLSVEQMAQKVIGALQERADLWDERAVP
ncbi:shikimate kinase [Maribius pontilimi]|uniref:Shikimate kinase n=1 Tax=Palleronia pontilimi TaxID=1964209 RepID=A0A934MCU2_9RHOB|nr:shikimate kinase [Palleronia pontilimi]MBJ3762870.1 shikimate kinase [Palleronia pontilimi]